MVAGFAKLNEKLVSEIQTFVKTNLWLIRRELQDDKLFDFNQCYIWDSSNWWTVEMSLFKWPLPFICDVCTTPQDNLPKPNFIL